MGATIGAVTTENPRDGTSPLYSPVALSQVHQIAVAQQRIPECIRFPETQERKNQVHEAHNRTYQWILLPEQYQKQQWDNILAFHHWAITSPIVAAFRKQQFLIPQVAAPLRWSATIALGNNPIEWTKAELQRTLYAYVQSVRMFAKVFLLIDGLDELDGGDDAQEELIDLLVRLADFDNIKVYLSSRPWNVFQEAFKGYSQLRLEDLTNNDISTYVKQRLYNHVRFKHLYGYDRVNAEFLIVSIMQKANGVFFWVRFVVRELLKNLRDGDGIRILQIKLDDIPIDLNVSFTCLFQYISPPQRQSASALLQTALYEEYDYITVFPIRLIDLSFMDEGRPDFALTVEDSISDFNPADKDVLSFRLDSTLRRLNSRCMGLLEYHYHPDNGDDEFGVTLPTGEINQHGQHRGSKTETSSFPVNGLTVDFLHRSCRDFLLTPVAQSLLHQYTHGKYDARLFLLNSRFAQFVALAKYGMDAATLSVASSVVSSIARPVYKHTAIAIAFADAIQPDVQRLLDNNTFQQPYWYINRSADSWHIETSSFPTLAVDLI